MEGRGGRCGWAAVGGAARIREELAADSWARPPSRYTTLNADFVEDFTRWIFKETGVLKVVETAHHRVDEAEPRRMYRIKDDLVRLRLVCDRCAPQLMPTLCLRPADLQHHDRAARIDRQRDLALGAVPRVRPRARVHDARPAHPDADARGGSGAGARGDQVRGHVQGAGPAWRVQVCGRLLEARVGAAPEPRERL